MESIFRFALQSRQTSFWDAKLLFLPENRSNKLCIFLISKKWQGIFFYFIQVITALSFYRFKTILDRTKHFGIGFKMWNSVVKIIFGLVQNNLDASKIIGPIEGRSKSLLSIQTWGSKSLQNLTISSRINRIKLLVIHKNLHLIKPALFSAKTEFTLNHVVQWLLYGCSVELCGRVVAAYAVISLLSFESVNAWGVAL